MSFSPSDVAALKAPDVLHAYCRAALGEGVQKGRLTFYRCPWGAHSRLKLEVTERAGTGVAMCRACDTGGSVFDVAAGVLGLDVKKDFAACVQAVAAVAGYSLTEDRHATRAQKSHRKPQGGFSGRSGVVAMQARETRSDEPLVYLPEKEEAAALDAVRRAAGNEAALAEHAARLGLPVEVLRVHTDIEECAGLGLLGLGKKNRLLYVYTHREKAGDPLRVLAVKTRMHPGEEPRFLMRGSKSALWGADAAAGAGLVILTEGESDALAVRAALWAWLEWWAHNEPDSFPAADDLPVVLARPDAGTFKPAWAAALNGKSVILATDADEAGRKGGVKAAGILHSVGVRRVFIWQPAAGCKDARAALDLKRPWLLAEDILTNKQPIQHE